MKIIFDARDLMLDARCWILDARTLSLSHRTSHISHLFVLCILYFVLCTLLLAHCSSLTAQPSKEPRLSSEPLTLVDLPTAGMLYHRNVCTTLEFFEESGMLATANIGLFNRLMLGVAYGGSNIIGVQKAQFNPHLGVTVKVRAVEEMYYVPAIVLGFNSQGKGTFIDSSNRYTTKSVGLYAVASKNFQLLGFFSIHTGIHYSLEDSDNRMLNLFVGLEKTFASIFSGTVEYDNGFSISQSNRIDKGRGLLNLGLRASISKNFSLGLNLKDIAQNQQDYSVGIRTIQIEYAKTF